MMNVCGFVCCVDTRVKLGGQSCGLVLHSSSMWVLGINPNLLNHLTGLHLLVIILEVLGTEPKTSCVLRNTKLQPRKIEKQQQQKGVLWRLLGCSPTGASRAVRRMQRESQKAPGLEITEVSE